jgi:hypothetical protein
MGRESERENFNKYLFIYENLFPTFGSFDSKPNKYCSSPTFTHRQTQWLKRMEIPLQFTQLLSH